MRNWSENKIELVLIRHGATKANQEHRYLGKTDESLSPEGIEELKKARQKGFYPAIDSLFVSPMKRCMETAEILYPDKAVIPIQEFEEMDFGIFEGKNYLDLQNDKRYQAWIDSNGTLPFPEGESREDFIRRCEQEFRKMIDSIRDNHAQGTIKAGAIVHGGTIMSVLSSFYGGDYFDYQIQNGKGYICKLKGNTYEISHIGILSGVSS